METQPAPLARETLSMPTSYEDPRAHWFAPDIPCLRADREGEGELMKIGALLQRTTHATSGMLHTQSYRGRQNIIRGCLGLRVRWHPMYCGWSYQYVRRSILVRKWGDLSGRVADKNVATGQTPKTFQTQSLRPLLPPKSRILRSECAVSSMWDGTPAENKRRSRRRGRCVAQLTQSQPVPSAGHLPHH